MTASRIDSTSPTSGSKTAGIAEVFRRGSTTGILIAAQNVPPNSKHDAYAVWIYNSSSDAVRLGFVLFPRGPTLMPRSGCMEPMADPRTRSASAAEGRAPPCRLASASPQINKRARGTGRIVMRISDG